MPAQRLLSCLISLYFLVAGPCSLLGQILPVTHKVNWAAAGYDGDVPYPKRIENVRAWGASGDGKTDDFSAIQSAIDSLRGRSGVIYFPQGIYVLHTPLRLPDSVVLRGEGMGISRLAFDLQGQSGHCIAIEGEAVQPFTAILSGGKKDSLSIKVTDVAGFIPGSYVEIRQENGEWDTQPAPWAAYSMGQMARIRAVSDDRLWLEDALRTDLDTALHPEVRIIRPRQQVGIECLTIERVDRVAGGFGYNISFAFAAQCWIRGIESDKSIGSHVFASASTDITISGSYFHDAYEFDGASTRGYGITLAHHTGQVLIQDNIFERLRHAMMVKQGANGNVFGYNYSTAVVRTEFPHDLSGDISLHGHFAFANLFEGNVVQSIIIDHYWGPSGPRNTFLRNRAESYGIILGSLDPDARLSNGQNFLGNEVTNQLGFPGYYILTGEDHFAYANHLGTRIEPFSVEAFSDHSYYLREKPGFFGATGWPAIGIPQPFNQGLIPAQRRFTAESGLAVCEEDALTGAATTGLPEADSAQWHIRGVYPNPFRTHLALELQAVAPVHGRLSMSNLQGEQVWSREIRISRGLNRFEWKTPEEWTTGVYLIYLKTPEQEISIRVLKE